MKLYGLIGFPLSHSFSSEYFKEKFLRENISNTEYRNFPIKSIQELESLLAAHTDLLGLNVTIPYKKKIIPLLDEIEDTAMEIGAVNTVKISKGKSGEKELKGYNTDVFGFFSSISPLLNKQIDKALILGTGGASVAVKYILEKLNILTHLVSRNPAEGQFHYSDLNKKLIKEHLLIVNTTPLGTFPDVENAPEIPYEYLGNSHVLYDLVYNPPETLFMKKGKQKNARVKNGYDMLRLQADESWRIWNRSEVI